MKRGDQSVNAVEWINKHNDVLEERNRNYWKYICYMAILPTVCLLTCYLFEVFYEIRMLGILGYLTGISIEVVFFLYCSKHVLEIGPSFANFPRPSKPLKVPVNDLNYPATTDESERNAILNAFSSRDVQTYKFVDATLNDAANVDLDDD